MSAAIRHEIKEVLKDWARGEDINLSVEKLYSIMDREAIKRELGAKDFQAELRFPVQIRILPDAE